MGSSLWIQSFYTVLVIVFLIFYWIKSLRARLGTFLIWNALLRLFMETYLESTLLSTLNVHMIDWNTDFTTILVSNILAVTYLTLFSVVPPILLYKFCKSKDNWDLPSFKAKLGTLL